MPDDLTDEGPVVVRFFTRGWWLDAAMTVLHLAGVVLVAGGIHLGRLGGVVLGCGALALSVGYVQLLARGQWESRRW